jgi:hypothetical protein
MSFYPRLVLIGTSGETDILADATTIGDFVEITLTADYNMDWPPGFVIRPFGLAAEQYPHTFAAGRTLSLPACEAGALVTAKVATYV